jgi:ATP-dependent RNA helicase RhlE
VLAPTRELALQIMENIRGYGRHLPVRVAAVFGGVDEEAQLKASLQQGSSHHRRDAGTLARPDGARHNWISTPLEVLVLDEADRMLHMGFLPDIENIVGMPCRSGGKP